MIHMWVIRTWKNAVVGRLGWQRHVGKIHPRANEQDFINKMILFVLL